MTLAQGQASLEDRGFEVLPEGATDDEISRAELLGPTTVILDSANPGGGSWERRREC